MYPTQWSLDLKLNCSPFGKKEPFNEQQISKSSDIKDSNNAKNMEYHYQLAIMTSPAYKELHKKHKEMKDQNRREKELKMKVSLLLFLDLTWEGRGIEQVHKLKEKIGVVAIETIREEIITETVHWAHPLPKIRNVAGKVQNLLNIEVRNIA